MPKKTFKLQRFDGGINNDSNPRDIADNEQVSNIGLAGDSMGKIKRIGSFTNITDINSNGSLPGSSTNYNSWIIKEGTGLHLHKTDYKTFLLSSTAEEANGNMYITSAYQKDGMPTHSYTL